tara:strand:- start:879 stop:2093 length:1215 start_codon:yes stop_codon:yes gene_type:complete
MLNLNKIRRKFPSLSRKDNEGNKIIYLDGPGGTQVPEIVIEGISRYYKSSNSNIHGEFITSIETDKVMESMREKVSVFLGAENKDCISIGQNMTTLNFSLSRALSKIFKIGDEIIITELDHEANRGPWKLLEDKGIKIIEINLLSSGELDYNDFKRKINEKTVMVAMGMSSNALGTINDFEKVKKFIKNHNILFLLDAVHFAPHFSIDVQEFECDFLLCSAYKFYGPHIGLLYSKPNLLTKLNTERLIVQNQNAPYKIETGTLNHAACYGVSKSIDFIASIGEGSNYREKIIDAYKKLGDHEYKLASYLYDELNKIEKIKLIGPNFSNKRRTPTISFIHENKSANQVCKILGRNNICAWDGHFYALKAIQKLGIEKIGGVTRLGISAYNTKEEISRTIDIISKI